MGFSVSTKSAHLKNECTEYHNALNLHYNLQDYSLFSAINCEIFHFRFFSTFLSLRLRLADQQHLPRNRNISYVISFQLSDTDLLQCSRFDLTSRFNLTRIWSRRNKSIHFNQYLHFMFNIQQIYRYSV